MKRISHEELIKISDKYLGSPMAAQLASAQAQLEADKEWLKSFPTTEVLDEDDDKKNYQAYLIPVNYLGGENEQQPQSFRSV